MTQNIYDDPDFFAGYSQLPRSVHGLGAAAEWPELQRLLPPIAGLDVVDLGCGFGWFCRWAAERGATSVLGLDVSQNMLDRARADTEPSSLTVEYRRVDLDALPADTFDGRRFHLAYSSLTLHYLRHLDELLAAVRAALHPGGHLVCSVEHPVFTAPANAAWTTLDGRSVWPLDGYSVEGDRVTEWLAPGVVKQHRTISTYVTALLRHGFELTALREWSPTDAQVREHPEWEIERDRPPFLLLAAKAGSAVVSS